MYRNVGCTISWRAELTSRVASFSRTLFQRSSWRQPHKQTRKTACRSRPQSNLSTPQSDLSTPKPFSFRRGDAWCKQECFPWWSLAPPLLGPWPPPSALCIIYQLAKCAGWSEQQEGRPEWEKLSEILNQATNLWCITSENPTILHESCPLHPTPLSPQPTIPSQRIGNDTPHHGGRANRSLHSFLAYATMLPIIQRA